MLIDILNVLFETMPEKSRCFILSLGYLKNDRYFESKFIIKIFINSGICCLSCIEIFEMYYDLFDEIFDDFVIIIMTGVDWYLKDGVVTYQLCVALLFQSFNLTERN